MDVFDIARLEAGHDFSSKEPYLEFIRAASLSMGLYVLSAGAEDPQRPHTEDEAYHVVDGRARILIGEEDRAVGAGTMVFVGPGSSIGSTPSRRISPRSCSSRPPSTPEPRTGRPSGRARPDKRMAPASTKRS